MSAQKRKNFKEKIGGAYVIICHETLEIQNNFVILQRLLEENDDLFVPWCNG